MRPLYLDYSGIRVTNLRRALAFFSKALGLVERRRGTMGHGGVWVLLEDPTSHQFLELNYYPKGTKYATPFVPGEGLDHLGVRTSNMAAAGRQLRRAGATRVVRFPVRGAPVVEYYEGPDGIWVELIAP